MPYQFTIEQLAERGYYAFCGREAWFWGHDGSLISPCFSKEEAIAAASQHCRENYEPPRPDGVPQNAEFRLPKAGEKHTCIIGSPSVSCVDWHISDNDEFNNRRWCWREEDVKPAKPEYKSGWVEYNGKGYKVQGSILEFIGSSWMIGLEGFGVVMDDSVRECPPRPEPPKGWKLTGRVSDSFGSGERWITPAGDISTDLTNQSRAFYSGLRWEAVRDEATYTADTFPKGMVWIRKNTWFKGCRSLVLEVVIGGIWITKSMGDETFFEYSKLTSDCELSLDGGQTWKPAKP